MIWIFVIAILALFALIALDFWHTVKHFKGPRE